MITRLRLGLALVVILMATLVLAPVLGISRLLGFGLVRKIPRIWHAMVLRLLGMRVEVHGEFSNAHPLLLVCNHVSWADIVVLGSIKELCFVAKSEVGSWPIINWFAKMQRTIFIDRANSRDAANQADTIAARLLSGDVMVLFAEGTTGDGNTILAFKSSLFGAAQYAIKQSHIDKVLVQPVAISYTRLHGLPLGRRYQVEASWPGEVALGDHLMNFLKKSAFDVDIVLGEPLEFTLASDRKKIALATNQQVTAMFARAMNGSLGENP